MSEETPPARRLALKPREVEPADGASLPVEDMGISAHLVLRENQLAAQGSPGPWPGDPVQPAASATDSLVFRKTEITPADSPAQLGDGETISVHVMLNRNHSAARDSGPELIAMPPHRKSRRQRDFIMIMAVAVLSVCALAAVFRHDRQMVDLALFGIVFVTVILVWIMYGVMDRY
jgi:hypothetical protein